MKKLLLLCVLFAFAVCMLPISVGAAQEIHIYVSTNGSDSAGDGSLQNPYRTIEKAKTEVAKINQNMNGDIYVSILEGDYTLSSTVKFTPKDSGTNGYSVIYKGEGRVHISGGKKLENWTKVSDYVWKTDSPVYDARQLYIHDEPTQMATTDEPIHGSSFVYDSNGKITGIRVTQDIPEIADGQTLELFSPCNEWKPYIFKIQSVEKEESGSSVIHCGSKLDSYVITSPPATGMHYFRNFYIRNAKEFLDKNREWCFHATTREIFLYSTENPNLMDITVPVCETLFDFEGDTPSSEVHNIAIENLTLKDTHFYGITNEGLHIKQAQHLYQPWRPNGNYMPPAAVMMDFAENITVKNCVIKNGGGSGIGMYQGVQNSRICNNTIYHLADGGIVVGTFSQDTVDNVTTAICVQNEIADNEIYSIGLENTGAPGIQTYYTEKTLIRNNTLYDLPYTGIAAGWGWSGKPNSTTSKEIQIKNNLIYDYMNVTRDGAGIYTLGQNPDSEISGNYIAFAKHDYAGIYLDEGSQWFHVSDNVILDTPYWLMLNGATVKNNTIGTTYTNISKGSYGKSPENAIAEPTIFDLSSQPEVVKNIYQNSGVRGRTLTEDSKISVEDKLFFAETKRQTVLSADASTSEQLPFGKLFYKWTLVSAPDNLQQATIIHGEDKNCTAVFHDPGNYVVELTVSSGVTAVKKQFTVVAKQESTEELRLVSQNKPATACDGTYASFGASKVNDGNLSSIWATEYTTGMQYIDIDLQEAYDIAYVEVATDQRQSASASTRKEFEILLSNDIDFTNSVRIGQQEKELLHKDIWLANADLPTKYRYVRFQRSIMGTFSVVSEIKVYARKDAEQTSIPMLSVLGKSIVSAEKPMLEVVLGTEQAFSEKKQILIGACYGGAEGKTLLQTAIADITGSTVNMRLPYTDGATYKFFVWDQLAAGKPLYTPLVLS